MIGVSVKVSGLRQLDRALKKLDRKTAKKVMRGGLREGAAVVREEARRLVPVKTGTLRKSIKVRAARSRHRGEVAVSVTTSPTDNLFAGDQFYGGFIEFGWDKVPSYRVDGKLYSKKRGSTPTTPMPGVYFMTRAARSKINEASRVAIASMWKRMAQSVRRGV